MDGNASLDSESDTEDKSDDEEEMESDHVTDDNDDDSGNESINEIENVDRAESYKIPVVMGIKTNVERSTPAWHETYTPRPGDLPTARKTIRQDQRLETGAALPSFSAPNCRSLGPKLNNFQEDMLMRNIGVALCSETWEKSANKKFQKKVEIMLEMKSLKMISNPRKYQRCGGVCIIADLTKVNIHAVEVSNPDNVEAVFAIVKPKIPSEIKEIITFAFYSPPRSKKKKAS